MKNYVIITAAGEGTRLPGAVAKQFRPIANRPLLSWTIDSFENCQMVDAICLVVPEFEIPYVQESVVNKYNFKKVDFIVAGGKSRFDSILCGLKVIPEDADIVWIHDGVRPLIQVEEIEKVGNAALAHDAAILVLPVSETVKRVEDDFIITTLDRDRLYLAQTPQAFKYELILSAYIQALDKNQEFTDDASVCEAYGVGVRIVTGSNTNIKITTDTDLEIARILLSQRDNQGPEK